jgi:Family of unknown function (DUF6152)
MTRLFPGLQSAVPITMALLLGLGVTDAALAHHSFAAYDQSKTVAVQGTVKEFRWVNPHIGILLAVSENGQEVDYLIAGGALSGLVQAGWRKTTLKPGDSVTVNFHPMKDGQKAGELLGVTLADGSKLGDNSGPGNSNSP